jgi:small subunit ribosomal protein S8
MLANIKNSLAVSKDACFVTSSKINERIAQILKDKGFISDFQKEEKTKDNKERIKIYLKYTDNRPAITEIRRISRLGRRLYSGYKDVRVQKFGLSILSTPKGIMTSADAKKHKVGGEIICFVR